MRRALPLNVADKVRRRAKKKRLEKDTLDWIEAGHDTEDWTP